jgi:hypothetical protein
MEEEEQWMKREIEILDGMEYLGLKVRYPLRYIPFFHSHYEACSKIEIKDSDVEESAGLEMQFSDQYGLNNRVLLNIRPLCMFSRPGVLLEGEFQLLNSTCTCSPKNYAIVVKYLFSCACYMCKCPCGNLFILNPYQVEDNVVPVHSKVYVRCSFFLNMLGNLRNTKIVFLSDGSTLNEGIQSHVYDDSNAEESKVDSVECTLCIPCEDTQAHYIENNFTSNDVVCVCATFHKENKDMPEIERSFFRRSHKNGSKYIVYFNVNIREFNFYVPNNGASTDKRMFKSIGLE